MQYSGSSVTRYNNRTERVVMKQRKIKLANQKPTKKELDDLCREVVKRRSKGKCERCNSQRYLQWSHFITRGNHAVRWDLDNVFWLCSGCHVMRNDSFHKSPPSAVDWVRHRIGEKNYEELCLRATGKCGDKWLIKIYLQQKLKELT